jgi:hypothetical protein
VGNWVGGFDRSLDSVWQKASVFRRLDGGHENEPSRRDADILKKVKPGDRIMVFDGDLIPDVEGWAPDSKQKSNEERFSPSCIALSTFMPDRYRAPLRLDWNGRIRKKATRGHCGSSKGSNIEW